MRLEPFGEWLKNQREKRGWSLRKLAEESGITHPRIVQIEAGAGATRDMVRKLADGLGVPRSEAIKYWLGDEGQEGGPIVYVTDPERVITVERYEGLGTTNRRIVDMMIRELHEAEQEDSKGKRHEDDNAVEDALGRQ